jgi:hypothetical protein
VREAGALHLRRHGLRGDGVKGRRFFYPDAPKKESRAAS